jgi:hypothetical protein
METWVWILIAVGAAIVLLAAALALWTTRRRSHLQERFGPEYDRTVAEAESRRAAERELTERERRREQLDVKPLSDASRTRYADEWQAVQGRFVDDPEGAVGDADRLVQRVMAERGYPTHEDFERRAAEVSVDHPDVVENFREGHRLWQRYDSGEGGTEDLRQAMVYYRSLFEELLEGERGRQDVEQEVR